MTAPTPTQPAQVRHAVRLLYAVVALGVIRTLIVVIRHWEVRSPDLLLVTKFVIYALSLALIHQLARGRDWARWTLVAILTIALPMTILPNLDALTITPVYSLLGVAQLGLYVWALVLLFRAPGGDWFRGESKRN